MKTVKQDNSDSLNKLALRRQGLTRWHPAGAPLSVLDCCAGHRHIWGQLRTEFPVEKYVGIDKAVTGQGNIRLDSAIWLRSVRLATYDVIDVDVYGDPWSHWMTILQRIERDTTVFLTEGIAGIGMSNISKAQLALAGIPQHWAIPRSAVIREMLTDRCLQTLFEYSLDCGGCLVSHSRFSDTRYYAVRLLMKKGQ